MLKIAKKLVRVFWVALLVPLLATTTFAAVPDLVIANVDELKEFADSVSAGTNYSGKVVVLESDIDLEGAEWTPIGDGNGSSSSSPIFRGTFDGGNHTIKNFSINENAPYVGFFSATDGATIKNLTIDNATVINNGSGYSEYKNGTGAIVGHAQGGGVENCTVMNSDIKANESEDLNVGGIVGYFQSGKIENCYLEDTDVTGITVGGIVGYTVSDVTLSHCHTDSNSTITGTNNVGGIAGYASHGTIEKCSNSATIIGKESVGGIAGIIISPTLTECVNAGDVSGDEMTGGIVGLMAAEFSVVNNSYNTGTIEGGYSMVGGIVGTMGRASSLNTHPHDAYAGSTTISSVYNAGLVIINNGLTIEENIHSFASGIAGGVNFGTTQNSVSLGSEIYGASVDLIDENDMNRVATENYVDDDKEPFSYVNNYARKDLLIFDAERTSADANSQDGKDIDVTEPDWQDTAFAGWDELIWEFHDGNNLPTLKNNTADIDPVLDFISFTNLVFHLNNGSSDTTLEVNGNIEDVLESSGIATFENQRVDRNLDISTPTPIDPKYPFIGWYLDEDFTIPFDSNQSIEDNDPNFGDSVHLYARWAYDVDDDDYDYDYDDDDDYDYDYDDDQGDDDDDNQSIAPIAIELTDTLISSTVNSIVASGSTNIAFNNIDMITPAQFERINEALMEAGKDPADYTVYLDSRSTTGGVIGRMYIRPFSAATWTSSLSTLIDNTDFCSDNQLTQTLFGKYFTNLIDTATFSQKDAFPSPITVAIKFNLEGMDTTNLHFYSYNLLTNKYVKVDTSYFIDKNGYAHLTLTRGGTLIVSDGELVKQSASA